VFSNTCIGKDFSNAEWISFGVAKNTCPQFISSLDTVYSETASISSADGIITGLNMAFGIQNNRKYSVGSSTTYEYRNEWLKDYCLKNPNSSYSHAVLSLYLFMMKKGV